MNKYKLYIIQVDLWIANGIIIFAQLLNIHQQSMLISTVATFFLAIIAIIHIQPVENVMPVIQVVTSTLEDLQVKYGKRYKTQEEKIFRRVILERNKKVINDHNRKANNNFRLGENEFVDFTPEEFTRRFKGLIPTTGPAKQYVADYTAKKDLDSQKCYCSLDLALKKIGLEKNLAKNQQQYSKNIEAHIKKINQVDTAIKNSFNQIKKVISSVPPTIATTITIAARSSLPNTKPGVLPAPTQNPAIINAMSAVLTPAYSNLFPSILPNTGSSTANSSTDTFSLMPNLLSATLGTVSAPMYTFPLTNDTLLNDVTLTDHIATSSLFSNTQNPSIGSVSKTISPTLATTSSTTSTSNIVGTKSVTASTSTSTLNIVNTGSATTASIFDFADIDWSNMTGAVRHQGYCGSCYALTTVQVVQSCNAIFIFGGVVIRLSPQQVLDCAVPNYNGCLGGLLQWGYSFMQLSGVTSNFRYPYTSGATGVNGACKLATGQFKILSYRSLDGTCLDLRKQVQIKPVATAIKSSQLQFYSGGVFDNCTSSDVFDHAVVVVGFNSTLGWKFKNTWGATWGQSGYGWLSLDETKNCGICQMPVVPKCRGEP